MVLVLDGICRITAPCNNSHSKLSGIHMTPVQRKAQLPDSGTVALSLILLKITVTVFK